MKKKRLIILGSIVLVILIVVGILLLLPKDSKNPLKKTITGTEWGDIYYNHLTDENHKIPDNSKIGFIEIQSFKDPIMYTISSKKIDSGETYYDAAFYAIEDGEVVGHSYSTPRKVKVKLLYDVKNSKYRYYLSEMDKEETLTLLEPELKYANNDPEDKYKDESDLFSIRDDGHVYKYVDGAGQDQGLKEEYVIDTGIEEELYDYSKGEKSLQDAMKKGIKEYKDLDKLITKEIDKKIEDEKNTKQEDTKEESQSNENTNTNNNTTSTPKTLQVGDYSLKYGKYKACVEEVYCEEFTIREDNTVNYDGEETKFHISNIDFAQGPGYGDKYVHPAIVIEATPSGKGAIFTPYGTSSNCLLTDGDMTCVNFVG